MESQKTVSRELLQIDEIANRYKSKHGELLTILEQTQLLSKHNYLSEVALNRVAYKTGVPLSRIYNVVTFYSFFNLKPQGEHTITVCRGTACHTKGSKSLMKDLGLILGCTKELEESESYFTTKDNRFTISTVSCFGQCALAPVIAIDGIIHSNVNTSKLKKLINKISKGRNKK